MGTLFTRQATGNSTLSVNGVVIKEIRDESDFPAPVGGEIDLVANTTYVIRGNVSITNLISITADNVALVGSDREKDGLLYTGAAGAGDFITITDVNCEISNLKFSSTNNTAGDVVLRATNFDYTPGVYNAGRNKVLTIINCQFRNCFDMMFIEGFDLVDFQNTLTWYIQATSIGCHFKNVSKLQISSCEYVRWFDETNTSAVAWSGVTAYSIGDVVIFGGIFYKALTANTGVIPTTSLGVDWEVTGYATVPMIDLIPNGLGPGFGAVNISGSLWHPQQTQDGLKIDNTTTIGFGTISANTGVDVGLSTGLVTNFDYDIQNTTIVQANQKIQNGNAKGTLSIIGNANALNNSTTNPAVLNEANVGGSFTNNPTFPVAQRVITNQANCSFTYNSRIQANFFVAVTATVLQIGNAFITCRLRANGVPISAPVGVVEIRSGNSQVLSFSVLGVASQGDVFDIEFESSTASDVTVTDLVLNGYQF